MDVNITSRVQARAAIAFGYSGGHGYVAAPTSNPATRANHNGSSDIPQQLVAGEVHQKPHFDSAPASPIRPAAQGPLQLYTRPADRNEAAVGVALGRHIDVRA